MSAYNLYFQVEWSKKNGKGMENVKEIGMDGN